MSRLILACQTAADTLSRGDAFLGLAARAVFAAVLLGYYWASGLAKLGDGVLGLFRPSVGAYAQIFPRAMEAAGYDTGQLTFLHTLVVLAGTWAELILPLLIVIGLATRLAALGMIGFVLLQSATDIFGHGLRSEPGGVGAWFDRVPDSLIMDQRLLWVFVLVVQVIRGAGPVSLDWLVQRWHSARQD
ncbi:DoxX family protein [Roseovarius dicentrarchi]|uniref:DoxX family protein n=1 Tax=Roseovarius dicentrarchi TaxID=2250573 RepID=UPI000DEBD39D|nr:DoxX family protein [Roseovarius dicentrarchi]